jgi:hypothetical protein
VQGNDTAHKEDEMEGTEGTQPEPAGEVWEPGGREHKLIDRMTTEDLAAAYGDGVRFRSHGLASWTDETVARWLRGARDELRKRGKLDLVKEHLAVYFDPSRTPSIFGPGAGLMGHGAIEGIIVPRALQSAG